MMEGFGDGGGLFEGVEGLESFENFLRDLRDGGGFVWELRDRFTMYIVYIV